MLLDVYRRIRTQDCYLDLHTGYLGIAAKTRSKNRETRRYIWNGWQKMEYEA